MSVFVNYFLLPCFRICVLFEMIMLLFCYKGDPQRKENRPMGKYHLKVSCFRLLDEAESPEIASYRFKNTKVSQILKIILEKYNAF